MIQKEQLVDGWRVLAEGVAAELAEWRARHPRATLAQIQAQVGSALSRLQQGYLTDLVHASASADLADAPEEVRPRCAACSQPLQAAGSHQREVLVPGQGPPLRLRRSYALCPACGVGLFPPGRGTGAPARQPEPPAAGGGGPVECLDAL